MFSAAFWAASSERAVKTVAQALLSVWLVGDVAFNLLAVNWGSALGVAAGAGVISLLTSVVSAPAGPTGSPSLVSDGAVVGEHRADT
ncbi:MAG: holin [Pseudonocardia sp.]|nr:holin [Pseudonocardia sp.]